MEKFVLNVPKIKQLKNHCGVASLNMVLEYNDVHISQKELSHMFGSHVYTHGIDDLEIKDVARVFGFSSRFKNDFDFEGVMDNINLRIPIIATIKYFYLGKHVKHMLVIKGYDDSRRIYVNDPNDLRREVFEYNHFRKIWSIKEEGTFVRKGLLITN